MKALLLTLVVLHASFGIATAQTRTALVIGVNSYPAFPADRQLTSPVNDAKDIAASLRRLGFTVTECIQDLAHPGTTLTRKAITDAKSAFLAAAQDAPLALVYFSGHGFQVGDENYLIPGDMPKITSFTTLRENAVALRDGIMTGLEEAGAGTKVIILDCCRDNPFEKQIAAALSSKSLRTKGGTGQITGYGPGFFLAFATSPGTGAFDGNGQRNSPFTSALVTHLQDKAGENIRDLFDEVKSTVKATNGEEQVPWVNDSLDKDHLKVLAKLEVKVAPKDTPRSGVPLAADPTPMRSQTASSAPPAPAPAAGSTPLPGGSLLDQGSVGKVIQLKLPGGVVMKFCYCPAGSFTMGSPASEKDRGTDEDQVQVRITQGFWMAQTECTQGQWQAVMGTTPAEQTAKGTFVGEVKGLGADHPMYLVNATEADEFCLKVQSSVTLPANWKLALPTEAQWEYACRAGTESVFSFGDVLNGKQANCDGTAPYGSTTNGPWLKEPCAVASYAANAWGLHDMHGNVWEWCADWYAEKLPGGTDPHGPTTGVSRVHRGGSWNVCAARCRAARRLRDMPGLRFNYLGFRPALVPSR